MNVQAHSKNQIQLRQTLNDHFRGHIRTKENKAESGILIDDCKKVFVIGSAWQTGL